MKVALYAPLKSPLHPVPSGDRQIGRNLLAALRQAGHAVELASELRAYCPDPTPEAVAALDRAAEAEALRLASAWAAGGVPDVWFSYHPYYKSPDLIGPRLADRFGLPVVTLEASFAPKRAEGPHAALHRETLALLRRARLNIAFTERDRAGLALVIQADRLGLLAPFIDVAPYRGLAGAAEHGGPVRLVTVAMMREGDKLRSYAMLAEALARLPETGWRLDVVGDGPAGARVRARFERFPESRVRFLGEADPARVPGLLAGADLLVWPGCGEAFGIAYLEAQAAGLPVVAQATGGIPAVVRDGGTGVLTPEGDVAAYAAAVGRLIADAGLRRSLGQAARRHVLAVHSIEAASARLGALLRPFKPEADRRGQG
ncbi:glycosyltransferase family 4 protein [Prosthecomicrobium sp. N25]|uniref:glycosyltransferase family 4 protein n=1 Tax=Prosthecomicrobium sp. N25 TaxID=3129254 RepID=UPI00307821A6